MMMIINFMEFKKIRREGKVKKITIPTKSNLHEGEYVAVLSISELNNELQGNPAKNSPEVIETKPNNE